MKKPTRKVVHTIVKRLDEDKESSSSECSHYDTEGEITEVIASPQVTEGKFFEFTSGTKPVHIKICRPKDVTSCDSDDKVSESKTEKNKKWQMRIKLQSEKVKKKYLLNVQRRRMLEFRRTNRNKSKNRSSSFSSINDSVGKESVKQVDDKIREEHNYCSNTSEVNSNVVSENTDGVKVHVAGISSENTDKKCEDSTSFESSGDKDKDNGTELYYVVGTPLPRASSDPDESNLCWFLNHYNRKLKFTTDCCNDIFEAFLIQSDLKYVQPDALRTILINFAVQNRELVEKEINENLKARNISFKDYISFLSGSKTNGMDITLRCLSLMFGKSVVCLAEDYLWMSHKLKFEEFQILLVMYKGGKFAAAVNIDGEVEHCELPELMNFESGDARSEPFDHNVLNRSDFNISNSQIVPPSPEVRKSENTEHLQDEDVMAKEQSENTEIVPDSKLMAKEEDKINRSVQPEDSDSDRTISADGSLTEDYDNTKEMSTATNREHEVMVQEKVKESIVKTDVNKNNLDNDSSRARNDTGSVHGEKDLETTVDENSTLLFEGTTEDPDATGIFEGEQVDSGATDVGNSSKSIVDSNVTKVENVLETTEDPDETAMFEGRTVDSGATEVGNSSKSIVDSNGTQVENGLETTVDPNETLVRETSAESAGKKDTELSKSDATDGGGETTNKPSDDSDLPEEYSEFNKFTH